MKLKTLGTTAVTAACMAAALIAAGPASAGTTVVYDSIPKTPLPSDLPGVGFESTSTSEFGGEVLLAGGGRQATALQFTVSSGSCEDGNPSKGECKTQRGATFPVDFTARVYGVDGDGQPGKLVAEARQRIPVRYRPSANAERCRGKDEGKWYSRPYDRCFSERSTRRTIKFSRQEIPEDAIVSLAFNTTHSGYEPIGEKAPCYGTPAGCGYDHLSIATDKGTVSVGKQPRPDDAWLYSSWKGSYCDGGSGGVDVFRLDAKCWAGYQPLLRLQTR